MMIKLVIKKEEKNEKQEPHRFLDLTRLLSSQDQHPSDEAPLKTI